MAEHSDRTTQFVAVGTIAFAIWLVLISISILNARLVLKKCKDRSQVKRAFRTVVPRGMSAFLSAEEESKVLQLSLEDTKLMRRHLLYALIETVVALALLMPAGQFIINCFILKKC